MPHLHRLRTAGAYGVLQSCQPPVTAAAWTTCITGCQPYTHGVVGFKEYRCGDDSIHITSAATCRVPNLWRQLSEQGLTVASINVPWTYPCPPVNGVMVSGYGTPGTHVDFTWPPRFKQELLDKMPDFDFLAPWKEADPSDADAFEANMRAVERCFGQRVETARMVDQKLHWDVMMVQFQDLDQIQHRIWPYLERPTRDRHVSRRDRVFAMLGALDEAVARVAALADRDSDLLVVLSDHGFGPLKANIKVNRLLYDWGYLRHRSPWGRLVRRLRRNIDHARGKRPQAMNVELKSPVDWRRSKAMVMFAAVNGYLYVNLRGRQPHGSVEPGFEYDRLIGELRRRLMQVAHPGTGEKVFEMVVSPQELYGTPRARAEDLGDLILVPRDGYIVHQSTSATADPVVTQSKDAMSGCHYGNGIYVLRGPGVRAGRGGDMHIVDIAPTVCAVLGARPGHPMDGRVMDELFREPPRLEYADSAGQTASTSTAAALSRDDEELVHKRLAELGYMD